MKIIGIIGRSDYSPNKHEVMLIYDNIRKKLAQFDVLLVGIVPSTTCSYLKAERTYIDEEKFVATLNLCDGFVLQGGSEFYDYDLFVAKYAHELDKPLLGICLGSQVIGTYLGGVCVTMDTCHEPIHEVEIKEKTKLCSIMNTNKIIVNSRHKDSIKNIEENYVGARYETIIEAIEDRTKKFFLGVQWHPEDMNDEYSNKLFRAFINAVEGK